MNKSVAAKLLRQTLTSPATLAKLAARGMFASVLLNMPPDVCNGDITTYLNGVSTKHGVLEVYAPGDETGWAVVCKDGNHTGETELIYGVWTLHREPVEIGFVTGGVIEVEEVGEVDVMFKATLGEVVKVEELGAGVNLDMVPAAFDLEEIITEVAEACDLTPEDVDTGGLLAEVLSGAVIPEHGEVVLAEAQATPDVLESSKAYDDMSEAELLKEIEGVAPYQYATDAQVEEFVRKNRERAECKAEGSA